MNPKLKLMGSPNMCKTHCLSLIILSMKMKTLKTCINFLSGISFPVFLKMELSHVLLMDKQDPEKLLLLMQLQNMLSMIYLRLYKINKIFRFLCLCSKYMEENVWIYWIIKKNFKFLKIKIIRFKFSDLKKDKHFQQVKYNK